MKRRTLHFALALALVTSLVVPAVAQTSEVPKPKPATEDSRYLIGPEDKLDIHVWKEPDFTRVVPVRPDGKISLPLLQDIQAAGLTPSQLGGTISERLKKFITDPQVTVIVIEINSRRVFVIGEVMRPGAYPLMPGMTVLQALSSAGGFSMYANTKKIYVTRLENGKQVKFPFNYRAVLDGETEVMALHPGDTIVIP